jgi:glycosyltransferase involved in cell wall biosynthesis
MTIANVIREFKSQLPDADIYVFDNNSSDNTVEEARQAGAILKYEKRQGKGYVVSSMFKKVDADIYVLVDGDGTYPADMVNELIKPVMADEADMVIGSRLHSQSESKFKTLNLLGNKLFLFVLNRIFKLKIADLLSGYRVFNRSIVKKLPVLSRGFEIETELTVTCVERGYRILEIPVNLSLRPEGSESKINLFRDGFLIMNTIFGLFRGYKPFTVFGLIGLILITGGFIPGIIVIREFLLTGLIYRIPSVILAVGLVLSGLLVVFVGFILHTLLRRFQELDYQLQSIMDKLESDE